MKQATAGCRPAIASLQPGARLLDFRPIPWACSASIHGLVCD